MALTRVTITGADDSTDVFELLKLSREFPFVEWGILVSVSSYGYPRYPTPEWISKLIENSVDVGFDINFSMHMCGRWVRDLLWGDLYWNELPQDLLAISNRIQINTHGEPHKSRCLFVHNLLEKFNKEFIFQWDGINNHYIYAAHAADIKVSVLIDGSHGAGVLPSVWKSPASLWPTGYAGGLGPDNIVEQLQAIQAVNEYHFNLYDYWIDMETKVRTDDGMKLDISKVRKVLELTAPYIGK